MRNFSKLMTGSMMVGAALFVTACGGSETANTTDTNMTEMNSMEGEGTMNDVTAVDGAATGDNMAMDNGAMGGNMAGDNMSMSNDMGGNTAMGNMSNAM